VASLGGPHTTKKRATGAQEVYKSQHVPSPWTTHPVTETLVVVALHDALSLAEELPDLYLCLDQTIIAEALDP
jgi:hypothetical protein